MLSIIETSSSVDSSKLVTAVAHDLKEPVRTIFYYADLLKQKLGKAEDASEILANLVKATERMRLLIDDYLKFTIAGGRAEERFVVNASDALRFARSNLQTAIAEAGAIITSELLPSVAANVGALTEVFQNLIANSVKYHGENDRGSTSGVPAVARNGSCPSPITELESNRSIRRLFFCP